MVKLCAGVACRNSLQGTFNCKLVCRSTKKLAKPKPKKQPVKPKKKAVKSVTALDKFFSKKKPATKKVALKKGKKPTTRGRK